MLRLSEIRAAPAGADMTVRVAERRHAYDQEQTRRGVPVVLSHGTAPTGARNGTATEGTLLREPGQPSGVAPILYDPQDATLGSGAILAASTTDPAWTPLFPIMERPG